MREVLIQLKRLIINLLVIIRSKGPHTYLRLGKGAYVPLNAEIKTAVEIGDGTGINGKIRILGGSKVIIGKYCAFGADIKIISSNHDLKKANLQAKFASKYFNMSIDLPGKEIVIGHNVWIGDNVIILPHVTIGNGAVIGAGSIVTKDVPNFAIAVGNPAHIIKYRFNKKIINQLLKIQRWNWSEEKIKKNKIFFDKNLAGDQELILKNIIA